MTPEQAIVFASEGEDSSLSLVKGVVFLGCPHQGTKIAGLGLLAARILWPLNADPTVFAELEYRSMALRDLQLTYSQVVQAHRILTINLYEKRATDLSGHRLPLCSVKVGVTGVPTMLSGDTDLTSDRARGLGKVRLPVRVSGRDRSLGSEQVLIAWVSRVRDDSITFGRRPPGSRKKTERACKGALCGAQGSGVDIRSKKSLAELFGLCDQLPYRLEDELPPVKAWVRLRQDPRFARLNVSDFHQLAEQLLPTVKCHRCVFVLVLRSTKAVNRERTVLT